MNEALRLARLWRNGKLVGGDPHEVAEALLKSHEVLTACLIEAVREMEWCLDEIRGSGTPTHLLGAIKRSQLALKEYDK